MAQHHLVQRRKIAYRWDDTLAIAVLISFLAIFAVYISFVADESVKNSVIALTVMLSILAVVGAWAAFFAKKVREHFAVIEAELDEIREDLTVVKIIPHLRRVK